MLDTAGSQGLPCATFGLPRRAPTRIPPKLQSPRLMMTNWTPSATRADVLRMVRRYVELTYSIRSCAGRMAIDETRVVKRRDAKSGIMESSEVGALSWPEFLDVIKNGVIRKAVTALPEARTDVTRPASGPEVEEAFASYREVTRSEESSDEDCGAALALVMSAVRGKPMRCVAPRRDVSPMVRPKARSGVSSSNGNDIRNWLAQVNRMFGSREQKHALIEAVTLWSELAAITNALAAARSARERQGGKKRIKRSKHTAPSVRDEVARLQSLEREIVVRLDAVLQSNHFRDGMEYTLRACTASRDVEAECFGMAA